MSFISGILERLAVFAVNAVSYFGYIGVFFLMILESMIFPLPSELVMPFAGFLISQGKFSWFGVIVASTLGTLIGSLISYYIGKYGGNKLVLKYGNFFFLDVDDLKKTEKWFMTRGEMTIFVSRFIPAVRHVISIPAGIGKMDLKKFCVYTLLGGAIWNTFLAWLGFIVGENWNKIKVYSEYISIPIAIILLIVLIWFIIKHIRHKKSRSRSKKKNINNISIQKMKNKRMLKTIKKNKKLNTKK
jgi:membrane protein DedA with SNARE-associated domain